MPERPRVIICREPCPEIQPEQYEAVKSALGRWLVESTPAADGVDWEEQDGRLVAVVWRWAVAA